LAVKNDWPEFWHVPSDLKRDGAFVHSIVEIDGRALKYAADMLQRDYQILTAAIANNSVTITVSRRRVSTFLSHLPFT